MAKETTKNTTEETTAAESEHTASEFAAASEVVFGTGVMPECVIAAFRIAGIEKSTRTEAERIVKEFLKKEVD